MNGEATSEWAEAVLTIRPHLCAFIPGVAARIAWNAEDRLIARHEWELFPEPIGADGIAGEHRTFDARGVKISTQTITAPAP